MHDGDASYSMPDADARRPTYNDHLPDNESYVRPSARQHSIGLLLGARSAHRRIEESLAGTVDRRTEVVAELFQEEDAPGSTPGVRATPGQVDTGYMALWFVRECWDTFARGMRCER